MPDFHSSDQLKSDCDLSISRSRSVLLKSFSVICLLEITFKLFELDDFVVCVVFAGMIPVR